ncbi:MAG TPA: HPr(Ser) kinase/phosphatase [Rubricoccaceae bacterium]|nr:HPr(Ser) kinase/phosphatase [Rubricoccaceae bacterium]
MRKPEPFQKESITVAYMVDQMRARVGVPMEALNGADPEARLVTDVNLHRPGIALAGYTELFTHQRVQVLGNTECRFLMHLPEEERQRAFERLLAFSLPCIVLTEDNELPEPLLDAAERAAVPVYRTPMPTVEFMYRLRDFLEDQFAEQLTLHGSLVDVYGIGLLLTGPSGIGKSEVALDLVERGHRLVADDVVIATKKAEGVLMGAGTELAQHFMEVRGLGIVDVRAMFGIRAIRFQKRIEVIVRMHRWDEAEEYTRIGMVDETERVLDVELPAVKLPIIPGKNVTVICEVIAMNHLLRHYGYDPAEVFARRLAERIQRGDGPARPRRGIEWFEHDFE